MLLPVPVDNDGKKYYDQCMTEAEYFNALKALEHLLRNFEALKHALNQLSYNKLPGLQNQSNTDHKM